MQDKQATYYIKPENIKTTSKLDNYNTALLEVLTWQATGGDVAKLNEAVAQAQADSIFNSMNAHDQSIALLNAARLFQGEPFDSGG